MEFLTEEEQERLAFELTAHAGDVGIDEAEVQKAFEYVNNLMITYSLLENWRKGNLSAGWSPADQELVWKVTEAGKAEVENMLSGDTNAPVDGNRRKGTEKD